MLVCKYISWKPFVQHCVESCVFAPSKQQVKIVSQIKCCHSNIDFFKGFNSAHNLRRSSKVSHTKRSEVELSEDVHVLSCCLWRNEKEGNGFWKLFQAQIDLVGFQRFIEPSSLPQCVCQCQQVMQWPRAFRPPLLSRRHLRPPLLQPQPPPRAPPPRRRRSRRRKVTAGGNQYAASRDSCCKCFEVFASNKILFTGSLGPV